MNTISRMFLFLNCIYGFMAEQEFLHRKYRISSNFATNWKIYFARVKTNDSEEWMSEE